jgi:hypothetical protein
MGIWFWLAAIGASAVLALAAYYLCTVISHPNNPRNE